MCRFENGLSLPHMPDMVFPYNVLTLQSKLTGSATDESKLIIEFNAFDALSLVNAKSLPGIKVVFKFTRREMFCHLV